MTLYDEHETNSGEVSYQQGYGDYQQQSYPIGGNNDQQSADEQQYNYSSAVGYDGYSTYQQYDGGGGAEYDYNYDYNYGYSEGQQPAYSEDTTVIDDGKESHGYGYYDDTGYYYDGQWYSYDVNYDPNYDANYSTEDAASNWSQSQQQHYDEQQDYDYSNDYPPQPEPDYPTTTISDLPKANQQKQQQQQQQRSSSTIGQQPASTENKTIQQLHEDSVLNKPQQQLSDLYSKRRTMMNHGDLSSSGGSVESEQPMLRRGESNATDVTTPTGPDGAMFDFRGMSNESPLMMMGELDRLQTDMLSHHRRVSTSSGGIEEATMMNDYRSGSVPTIEPLDHRRGSIQSRLSQMSQQSRRERAEHFRRRRSSSICSDRDRDREHASPYTSYEDERTPVNEINLSLDMNDMTPIATQVPFPSQHQQQYKSVSFDEDDPHMYDRMDEPPRQSNDQMDQLPPPTTPPQDSVISAPPAPVQRPCQNLTPRQKWLWAFNKICAQLMASPQSNLFFLLCFFCFFSSCCC